VVGNRAINHFLLYRLALARVVSGNLCSWRVPDGGLVIGAKRFEGKLN